MDKMSHQAKKRFGQNFLIDEYVIADIIAAIHPEAEDNMVEIGPGLGALTRPLLERLNHLHVIEIDRDIICPCDYRDPDVAEFGACYCRLYVNKTVFESQNLPEVPERRPLEKQGRAYGMPGLSQQVAAQGTQEKTAAPAPSQPPSAPEVKKKLWYCKQCGYVVYREDPPYVCPICKAKREFFAEIETAVEFKG